MGLTNIQLELVCLAFFLYGSKLILAFTLSTQQSFRHIIPSTKPLRKIRSSSRIPFGVSFAASNEVSSNKPSFTNDGHLNHSETSHDSSEGLQESTETYRINLVLAKLANQCENRFEGKNTAKNAFRLLQGMIDPDTVAYNSVLKAFAKAAPAQIDGISAADRAQGLLDEMIAVHLKQNGDNSDWYKRNAQGTLSEEELSHGPPPVRVKPNVRSFSTVMDAWARNGNVEASLSVLKDLERRYKESGYDAALQPNTFSYNTVLSAYSKSKGGTKSAEQAQELLQKMPIEPDVISYNAVLLCWARSGLPDAGERAENLLRQMHIRPNARSYTAAMDAWSKSRSELGDGSTAAERARALLDEMINLFEKTNDEALRPNCYAWSTVIHAHAMSRDPFKAEHCFRLLQQMRELGKDDPNVLPNRITYNTVLNACATSSPVTYSDRYGPEKSPLKEMTQVLYQQMLVDNKDEDNSENEKLAPDHFTFGTLLKACANNIFWDDPTFYVRVFSEACRRGQVSFGVVFQLRQAVPVDVFREMLPNGACDIRTGHFNMADLPTSWKRNVKERNATSRKKAAPTPTKLMKRHWKQSFD